MFWQCHISLIISTRRVATRPSKYTSNLQHIFDMSHSLFCKFTANLYSKYKVSLHIKIREMSTPIFPAGCCRRQWNSKGVHKDVVSHSCVADFQMQNRPSWLIKRNSFYDAIRLVDKSTGVFVMSMSKAPTPRNRVMKKKFCEFFCAFQKANWIRINGPSAKTCDFRSWKGIQIWQARCLAGINKICFCRTSFIGIAGFCPKNACFSFSSFLNLHVGLI